MIPLGAELNISMKTQFEQPDLARGWTDEQVARLRRNGIPEHRIVIEWSEDIVSLWGKVSVTVRPE